MLKTLSIASFLFLGVLCVGFAPQGERSYGSLMAASVLQDDTALDESEERAGFHQIIKEQFIAGDWRFMLIVLLCLIFGLAIAF